MLDLTFGEQVKIVLSRKGMTIKELAELIEARTGKKMSRQNLTQRLSRDNFQEQDMRMIAGILECPLRLSILDDSVGSEKVSHNKRIEENEAQKQPEQDVVVESDDVPDSSVGNERDITIGELVDIHEELDAIARGESVKDQTGEAAYVEEMTAEGSTYEEPEYEEQPYEEPVYEEPEYEEQPYEEPVYEEPVYEEQPYEEPVYEEPEYEEQPYEEPVYEEPAYEEAVYEEPAYVAEEYVEPEYEETPEPTVEEILEEVAALEAEDKEAKKKAESQKEKPHGWKAYLQRRKKKEEPIVEEAVEELPAEAEEQIEEVTEIQPDEPQAEDAMSGEFREQVYEEPVYEEPAYEEEAEETGDINPYTGREYESNSVRMHPKRIGYVQVYDRSDHQWTDMTEWAFLGYQERKKALLGKDYDPPIYLD